MDWPYLRPMMVHNTPPLVLPQSRLRAWTRRRQIHDDRAEAAYDPRRDADGAAPPQDAAAQETWQSDACILLSHPSRVFSNFVIPIAFRMARS